MTTVTQIISDAYRQSNLIAVEASPTTNQTTEALRHLNRIVKSVFGKEAGEDLDGFPIGSANIVRPSGYPWYDTVPDGDWVVPENMRLVLNLEAPLALYLHPYPHKGARFGVIDVQGNLATHNLTIYGNGRLIEGAASLVLNTNNTNSEWFYRDDLATWTKYAPLIGADTFPFPEEFDIYFITRLAITLNPSYGTQLDQQSLMEMKRSETQLRSRYRQSKEKRSERALINLPLTSADRGYWGRRDIEHDPTDMFNRGYPYD